LSATKVTESEKCVLCHLILTSYSLLTNLNLGQVFIIRSVSPLLYKLGLPLDLLTIWQQTWMEWSFTKCFFLCQSGIQDGSHCSQS